MHVQAEERDAAALEKVEVSVEYLISCDGLVEVPVGTGIVEPILMGEVNGWGRWRKWTPTPPPWKSRRICATASGRNSPEGPRSPGTTRSNGFCRRSALMNSARCGRQAEEWISEQHQLASASEATTLVAFISRSGPTSMLGMFSPMRRSFASLAEVRNQVPAAVKRSLTSSPSPQCWAGSLTGFDG